MCWPNKHPTLSDMTLWKNAMHAICPSRCLSRGVEGFVRQTHRIWKWYWNSDESTLHCINDDGISEDLFVAGGKPNRYHYSHSQQRGQLHFVCLVRPTVDGQHLSTMPTAADDKPPTSFLGVLESWGNTWLWENMTVSGGTEWIQHSINDGSLVAVTDGSYIRELYPNLCSAAFVLECAKGRGRIVGSFSEQLDLANAYQGELLGLMAIHLILPSVIKIHPMLKGRVEIISDCLGALNRVSYLPLYRIPSQCRHSDILKNILVNCRDLSFARYYLHIKTHQDNQTSFQNLNRKAQLHCICDHAAKFQIAMDGQEQSAPGKLFPLKTVGVCPRGEDDVRYGGKHSILGASSTCAELLPRKTHPIPRTIQRHRLEISFQHTPRSIAAVPTVGVQTCPWCSGHHGVPVAPRC